MTSNLRRIALLVATALMVLAEASPAQVIRAFAPRLRLDQPGDITLIANTLMTCSGGGQCTNGRNGTGSRLNNNDHTMVYVDVDGDASTFNSSTATLTLPAGATVSWAGLYWGGDSNNALRGQVRFATPAAGYATLNATQVDAVGADYQGFVDVTARVQAGGNGTYRVGNVQSTNNSSNRHAGWALVVIYRDATQPMRNLVVFDGYASVAPGASVSIGVSGFVTPPAGIVNTRLGAVTYEGDLGYTGDAFRLNGTALSDARNPATNFFNSSVSLLGASFTAKTPNYLNQFGFDADVVDASGILANGATSATLQLTSTDDQFYPGVVTFATDLYAPVFDASSFTKSVVDVNGGQVRPGDELEYTVVMRNVGQDHAISTVMRDTLRAGLSYVAGSLQVLSGPNAGPKSDAASDDQAEYLPGARVVVARLGTGANATTGGTVLVGEETRVRFRVRVETTVPHNTTLANQAWLAFVGAQSGSALVAASDGDAALAGAQPTRVTVFAGVDLTGAVYSDLDHDAVRDAGEDGTGLVLWAKLMPVGGSAALAAVSIHPGSGTFAFTDVTPGTYTVWMDDNAVLADLVPVTPAGWLAISHPTGSAGPITVGTTSVAGPQFGLFHGGRVSGRVFRDDGAGGVANDGVPQAGESGVAGVPVRLESASCAGGSCDSTWTGPGGDFTLWFAHGAAGTLVLRARDLTGWTSTGASVGTTAGTYSRPGDAITFTSASGVAHSGVAFGDVPPSQWRAASSRVVAPGGTAFHAHRFTAGTAGALRVTATASPSPLLPGWGVSMIHDLDCDGLPDAGEPVLASPLSLTAGQTACLLVAHRAPDGAPVGAREVLSLSAALTFTGASPVIVTADSLTALTTVQIQNGLVLVKSVDLASARPGDVLTYTLTYSNPGPDALRQIVLQDATPAWTTFVDAACLALGAGLSGCTVTAAPATGGSGPVVWTLAGDLAPGASGTVRLRVRVE